MSKRTLIICKGVSGVGKSSFTELIAEPKAVCSADKFFIDKEGNYNFDATKLGQAHAYCRQQFYSALIDQSIRNIIIDNTNCKSSDYSYYVKEAEDHGMRVIYVVLEKRHDGKNVHNVPDHVLERQENNLKQNLKLR